MIKVSCVSYLNSIPFVSGLRILESEKLITLSLDTPADCAAKLIRGEVDLGLIPVATIPLVPGGQIVTDFCIGAKGAVKSVTLLSEVPLAQIKTILLDYQSRTSVNLTRILAKEFWRISPAWQAGEAGFENQIRGNVAGVVIGDRSLQMRDGFPYVYDLSEEWFKFTNMPFVFACWVTTKNLQKEFIDRLNAVFADGIDAIPALVEKLKGNADFYEASEDYLKNFLQYNLDDSMRKAMGLFLEKVRAL
ncbi:MAG: Chorismate dehydratase [Bacteroidetes bacterium ADurb.Bin397]|nr:MAG: Chorismate dehydratase [Bacteroidetes bacterium ADurb.Bin397]